MANWDQLYDLEPLLHTPPSNASKQPSYFACKTSKQYDSDVSSVSSAEGVDDFDSPIWWDVLDHEEEAIQRYREFLRGQLHKEQGCEQQQQQKAEAEVVMTRVGAKSKPLSATKTMSLPERCKKSDHTHIVEVMQDSHDLAGPVDFCFWSMNGQPCQCGKC